MDVHQAMISVAVMDGRGKLSRRLFQHPLPVTLKIPSRLSSVNHCLIIAAARISLTDLPVDRRTTDMLLRPSLSILAM